MENLQIFKNKEFGQVRTVNIKGEPWFVGKDVAVALGYKDTINALNASFVYRMSEIETRIEEQKSRAENALLKVMDIMDFLEKSSMELMVLELRFIDCKSWASIEKEMHFSRRSCFDCQNRALEMLLSFKKVRNVLQEYQGRYDK